jgi:hypothetical protein
MRSISDDTYMIDMYPPWSMYEPRIVILGCMVMEKLTTI